MKNTKSISKYLLPLAFIAMLCLPVFNSLTQIWTYERADENRGFKDSLHIDIKKLDPFPKECEAYVNDNFSFRKPMLDVYHHVKFSSLKVSPHPD